MKRIRFRRSQQRQLQKPKNIYPVNAEVLKVADMVNLIDENGEFLGDTPTPKALEIADERGFDLVCVSPKAQPPVCKLLDYGSFKYKLEKQQKKQKQLHKQIDIKSLRLSLRIGKHDIDVKLKQAAKFLEKNNKVKIELILRGRERQYKEQAKEVIDNFIESLKELADIKVEQPVKKAGYKFDVMIAPASHKEIGDKEISDEEKEVNKEISDEVKEEKEGKKESDEEKEVNEEISDEVKEEKATTE